MKETKQKTADKSPKINTIQQFKELYFPIKTSDEKMQVRKVSDDYGEIIAMSFLENIRKELLNIHK